MLTLATNRWTLIRLGKAQAFTRACLCGVVLEALHPMFHVMGRGA